MLKVFETRVCRILKISWSKLTQKFEVNRSIVSPYIERDYRKKFWKEYVKGKEEEWKC